MTELRRKLLIVEDELLMQSMLQTELSKLGFDIVTVDSAVDAKKAVNRFDPDIALIDVGLKGSLNGIHLGNYLHEQRPDIAQVYLTKLEDARAAASDGLSLPPGAGFVSKHGIDGTDALIDEINRVVRGRLKDSARTEPRPTALKDLAPKTKQVLELLAEGYSNQYIAEKLEVSQKTVEYYIDLAYKALDISKGSDKNPRVEAALRYQRVQFATDAD